MATDALPANPGPVAEAASAGGLRGGTPDDGSKIKLSSHPPFAINPTDPPAPAINAKRPSERSEPRAQPGQPKPCSEQGGSPRPADEDADADSPEEQQPSDSPPAVSFVSDTQRVRKEGASDMSATTVPSPITTTRATHAGTASAADACQSQAAPDSAAPAEQAEFDDPDGDGDADGEAASPSLHPTSSNESDVAMAERRKRSLGNLDGLDDGGPDMAMSEHLPDGYRTDVSKVCSLCQKSKGIEDFGPKKGAKDGKDCYCRTCSTLRRRYTIPVVRDAVAKGTLQQLLEKSKRSGALVPRSRSAAAAAPAPSAAAPAAATPAVPASTSTATAAASDSAPAKPLALAASEEKKNCSMCGRVCPADAVAATFATGEVFCQACHRVFQRALRLTPKLTAPEVVEMHGNGKLAEMLGLSVEQLGGEITAGGFVTVVKGTKGSITGRICRMCRQVRAPVVDGTRQSYCADCGTVKARAQMHGYSVAQLQDAFEQTKVWRVLGELKGFILGGTRFDPTLYPEAAAAVGEGPEPVPGPSAAEANALPAAPPAGEAAAAAAPTAALASPGMCATGAPGVAAGRAAGAGLPVPPRAGLPTEDLDPGVLPDQQPNESMDLDAEGLGGLREGSLGFVPGQNDRAAGAMALRPNGKRRRKALDVSEQALSETEATVPDDDLYQPLDPEQAWLEGQQQLPAEYVGDIKKRCALCRGIKPLLEFPIDSKKLHGRACYCQPCKRLRCRAQTVNRNYDVAWLRAALEAGDLRQRLGADAEAVLTPLQPGKPVTERISEDAAAGWIGDRVAVKRSASGRVSLSTRRPEVLGPGGTLADAGAQGGHAGAAGARMLATGPGGPVPRGSPAGVPRGLPTHRSLEGSGALPAGAGVPVADGSLHTAAVPLSDKDVEGCVGMDLDPEAMSAAAFAAQTSVSMTRAVLHEHREFAKMFLVVRDRLLLPEMTMHELRAERSIAQELEYHLQQLRCLIQQSLVG